MSNIIDQHMHSSDHWETVYRSKPFDAVSWYAPHLGESLRLIQKLCPDPMASITDIGGRFVAAPVSRCVGVGYIGYRH
jgi:hypothetical protein